MLPGQVSRQMAEAELDDKIIDHQIAILRSMTPAERNNPNVLNASRRKRIAAGSGTSVQEVNLLVRQFEETKKLMKQLGVMGKKGKRKGMSRFPGVGGFPF